MNAAQRLAAQATAYGIEGMIVHEPDGVFRLVLPDHADWESPWTILGRTEYEASARLETIGVELHHRALARRDRTRSLN